jgi:hypothetical protein
MKLAILALALPLLAQARHFHDGEVLTIEGATVTIRDPSDHPCLGVSAPRIVSSSNACSAGPGFFQVNVTDPDVDHIEIEIGIETILPGINGTALRFETFTSQLDNNDWLVGSFTELSKISTITVRLLKVKREKIFR